MGHLGSTSASNRHFDLWRVPPAVAVPSVGVGGRFGIERRSDEGLDADDVANPWIDAFTSRHPKVGDVDDAGAAGAAGAGGMGRGPVVGMTGARGIWPATAAGIGSLFMRVTV